MPFLRFKPWTRKTWILLFTAVGAGLFLPQIIGTVVDAAALLGDGYDATKFIGEGVNIFRVLVASVSVLLTLVFRRLVIGNDTQDNIFIIAVFLCKHYVCWPFRTANYFGRLANYFVLFPAIVLPMILKKLPIRDRHFLL